MTGNDELRKYLRKVAGDLKVARERTEELERRNREPIAIVGASCRYPGGVTSPEGLWELVSSGTDGITEFPEDRGWEVEHLKHPDPERPGTSDTHEGGFLARATDFDAGFFGIGPREALAMDPQQRLLLESAWEALEDAEIDPTSLLGSSTGVFAGVTAQDYMLRGGSTPEVAGLRVTGALTSVLSGRLAYTLGLEGPTMTIDTACSSSLVAMHLAAQALRGGECDLALAGGVAVMATPSMFLEFSRQRVVLSPDGRCKAFAASADGTGWSEGSALLVLQRLSDAKRSGRRIHAVMLGSAINQDGASNGLTAPNGPSQERVIRQALANAGLAPSEIDVVEAHGTGTPLGDPIEAKALLATYGQERANGPLALGSLKSNIGHTQAAAGVGGVIKMAMALREEELPPTIHVDEPTPHVDWSAGEVELLREAKSWPRGERPRRAGISSFGISGTNVHLIIEEPPEQSAPKTKGEPARPPQIPWAISAKTPDALRATAGRLAAHVERHEPDPLDVAHTLLHSRAQLDHRAVVVGADTEELLEGLDALAREKEHPGIVQGRATSQEKIAFVFPGHGSQWIGMGREMLDSSEIFARRMAECEKAFSAHLDFSMTEVLRSDDPELHDRADVVYPLLFSQMVSLADVWRSYGVEPDAVVGHSQGEVAAAVVAGAISLGDGARLMAVRSQALHKRDGEGGMVSVLLSAEQMDERLDRWNGQVSVAASNSPSSVTVACGPGLVADFLAQCEEEGVKAREVVQGRFASHSHFVEPMREELAESLGEVRPNQESLAFYSTVTGERTASAEMDAAYWYRNLREPVRFEQATRQLLADGFTAFIEVSAHPVLFNPMRETVFKGSESPERIAVLHTLRRDDGGPRRLLTSLAYAHARGVEVDFSPLLEGSGASATELPTYPFQRQRFWLESQAGAGDMSTVGQTATEHPFLGASIALASEGAHLLTGRISAKTHPWLTDHAVAGTPILPGVAFAELALRAGAEVGASHLAELILQAPMPIPEAEALQVQLTLTPSVDEESFQLAIYSRPEPSSDPNPEAEESPWVCHAQGTLVPEPSNAPDFDASAWPPAGAEPIDSESFYDLAAEIGAEYGPAFQGLGDAWRSGAEIFAEVSLAPEQEDEAGRFAVHPALLDAALHPSFLLALLSAGDAQKSEGLRLPFSFSGLSMYQTGGASALRVRVRVEEERISLAAADEDGAPLCSISSIATRKIDPTLLGIKAKEQDSLFAIDWTELELPEDITAGHETYTEPQALFGAFESGTEAEAPPALFVYRCTPAKDGDPPSTAHTQSAEVLALVQSFLAAERLSQSRFAIVTEGAIASGESPDLSTAAVWGLIRSAQSEHPGRLTLIDTDGTEASEAVVAVALAIEDEPQLALRGGKAKAPRLVGAGEEELSLPEGPWRLEVGSDGTLESLAPGQAPEVLDPLQGGGVRVAVHAAGLNFRDVLNALGMFPEEALIGGEGAGVVVDVGPEVTDLRVGDRVLGLLGGAFGPLALTEQRFLAPLPESWSFGQGAAVPIVACTALYGLVDLDGLKAGERVLIHAGAGGVGMVAIQIARHLGAEVFATASPSKWDALRDLGLDEDHIASSRTLEFKEKFLGVTDGEGMDVVLDSLAREFVDASLDLLPNGGRFLEMGKTDVRDPERVAETHPGVSYRAFDLIEASPDQIQRLLVKVLSLFEAGAISHSPLTSWDIRNAPDAFRFLSQARHIGKNVITVPQPLDPEATILITGGLSGLGALTARHLAKSHGARHLLLLSRRGEGAPGAKELVAELGELGCEAIAAKCDASDRDQLKELIAGIPPEHPLTAIYHSAGVLDDGLIADLDPERLQTVLAPKANAAWNLHELTKDSELSAFVLYSSAAATFGSPGQGNYAAANAFLDALAQRRRSEGLPATSIAWGAWARESELGTELDQADRERIKRLGFVVSSDEQGLELLDSAQGMAGSLALAASLDTAALRPLARAGLLPPLLSGLVRTQGRRSKAAGSFARRLATVPEGERQAAVLALVREHAAAVLGQSSSESISPRVPFKELGFDSLGAVELRNRLAQAAGIRLEATLVFDHPTPEAIAGYLLGQLEGKVGADVAVRAMANTEEPIAIVGASCRYPGGVSSPEGLWDLVAAGTDAISEFPADRGWDSESLYDPDPERPGTTDARAGGFLERAAEFDSAFFGIGPREALAMDPQQRLLLEGAWEALEDAGIDPTSLHGSSTGVFAGVASQDYMLRGGGIAPEVEGLRVTGSATSILSGRLAYTLGLEGPAVTIDTACSSSLVALHLAAQALHSGECDLALAGGVTVMATPGIFIELSRQRFLAPDGRCKSFGAAADGTGWSEGSGLLLLQRLSDAKRSGRRIHAVIRGSATNQDGASNGLTAPNGPSQERVIRQALANAGLTAAEIDAVEAHGTGTTLGDPIEAGALLATYGQERSNGPLALGSLKSNVGHTQAAAGVGGVIKMAMALRKEELPPTLHAEEPTPHVDWESGEIELLGEARKWPRGERPRRAGISSFGVSGTNAHLILEEAPEAEPVEKGEERPPQIPWALSAKTPEALRETAGRLAAHAEQRDPDPLDVAHTLLFSRAQLDHRAVVVGKDTEELLAGLDALAQEKDHPGLVQARAGHGKSALLLSGQGSQRPGMGKELYEAFPVFARTFDRACTALEAELGYPVKEVVFAKPGTEEAETLSRTDLTQASLFALQVALHALTSSFGLVPDYLIGHSIGEISAAQIAGVLSLEDASKLVAARGKLMAALPVGGAMASVRASLEEVIESLEGFEESLCIAAINGPASIVVSGDEDALAQWEARHAEQGTKTKRLEVSHAFHSQRMEPMLAEFEEVAKGLTFNPPKIPILSNVTGEELTPEQATSPAYWASHIRQPVRFADGIAKLASLGVGTYLELGPEAVLCALAAETLAEREGGEASFTAALREGRPEPQTAISLIASAHANGAEVDFSPLFQDSGASTVELPTYPFQRQRYWLEAEPGHGDASSLGQSATEHPFLGASIPLASNGQHLLTGRISQKAHPWLVDHAVAGTPILPGVAFTELALRAGAEVGAQHLEELILQAPMPIPESGALQIQLTLTPSEDEESFEVAIYSRLEPVENEGTEEGESPFTQHAQGILTKETPNAPDFDATLWPPAGAEPIESEGFYDLAAELGVEYGPAFQGFGDAWRLREEIFAEVSLAPEQEDEAGRFALHPALLDAALHPAAVLFAESSESSEALRLPFSFSGLVFHQTGGASALRVRLRLEDERISLEAADETGVPLYSIEEIATRRIDPSQLADPRSSSSDSLFAVQWPDRELPEGTVGEFETHADPEAMLAAFSTEGEGGQAPRLFLYRCAPSEDRDPLSAVQSQSAEALQLIQAFLANESLSDSRLAILTEGRLADGESPDLAMAALWGLVRSAQSERPGRLTLIDSDGGEASEQALSAALAIEEEPQLALREGKVKAPRLAAVKGPGPTVQAPELDPEGTVLITGGLSGLGALTARHLAKSHGARHLLLVSRRGDDAPGAKELLAELEELGAEATAAKCDASDRDQLAELIAEIADEHPLTAIYHSAGVLDDGLVADLDSERLRTVLTPKVDAAWNLHELTADHDLQDFVLYSSAAATFGSPGQGNYAAANSFLDALAQRRCQEGLPATSIAWGVWARQSELTAELTEADRERARRVGLVALSDEQGLELLDSARALAHPLALAVPLDTAALRPLARAGILPPMLSGLVRSQGRRVKGGGSLARRLATIPEPEREAVVLGAVREHVAAILAHSSPEAIEPDRALLELGLDSLGAVELRNRLAAITAIQLPPTLAFDHPTSEAIAAYLLDRLAGEEPGSSAGRQDGTAAFAGVTFRTLVANAHKQGKAAAMAPLLAQASEFHPAFRSLNEFDEPPLGIQISSGGVAPRLICIPSFVVGAGPHQFVQIARALEGRRALTALSLPGFRRGEPLPASWDLAVDVLAESILEIAEGDSFVLVGYSSGGVLAHSLTAKLEREAAAPLGLVMIDLDLDLPEDSMGEIFSNIMGRLFEMDHEAIAIDDDHLIKMGAYIRMLSERQQVSLDSPELMLRASERLIIPAGQSGGSAEWPSGETVEIEGDHFALIADSAEATAEAIESWLKAQFSAGDRRVRS